MMKYKTIYKKGIMLHKTQFTTLLAKSLKEKTAIIILSICVATTLLSVTSSLMQENHEHDNDGAGGCCATCTQLLSTGVLRKHLDTISFGLLLLSLGLYFAPLLLPRTTSITRLQTLISLKVQANR